MGLGIFRGGMEAEGASSTTGKLAELRQQDEELETGASARSGGRGRCRAGPPRMDPATNEAHKKLWMGWVEGERRPLLAPLGMRPKIISSNKFKDTTHKRFYRPFSAPLYYTKLSGTVKRGGNNQVLHLFASAFSKKKRITKHTPKS